MKKARNTRKALSLLLVLCLTLAALVSCGASVKDFSGSASNDAAYEKEIGYAPGADGSDFFYTYVEKDEMYAPTENESVTLDASTATAPDPLAGRKIIKTVNVVAETKSFDSALASIESQVDSLGGYIQSSNVYGNSLENKHSGYRRASYTLRIPAEHLDYFMSTVGDLLNITSSKTGVNDITDTYVDIEARLTALKTEEARLLELLSQGKNLSDIITVEERLSNVRYEIESYTARLRGYDTLVAFSTVNLEISEVIDYTPEPIKDPSFGERLGKALGEGWEDFTDGWKDFTVGLAYALPSLILFAVFVLAIVIVITVAVKRSRKRRVQIPTSKENNEQPK